MSLGKEKSWVRKFQTDFEWKKPLVVAAIFLLAIVQFLARTEPRDGSAVQRGRARTDRCTTGRQLPELH